MHASPAQSANISGRLRSMPNQVQQNEAKALLGLLKDNLDAKNLEPKRLEETLTKLKILGRDVTNISAIYDDPWMKVLGSYAFGEYGPRVRQEASRCVANALLLLPSTRKSSLNLGFDKMAADALQKANDDEEFLLARILFLLTYDPSIDLKALIVDHDLAGSIIKNLSRHADELKSTSKARVNQTATAALGETLKLLFNVTNCQTDQTNKFNPAVVELLQILDHSDIPTPPLQPPISLLINALANLELGSNEAGVGKELDSGAENLITILELALEKHSITELDTIAISLLTVLRNINEVANPEVRDVMKARLLPDDKERDQPLGKSSSLASKLLRLTTSSGLLNLSEAISGLMFELSDKDANEYVKNVGYGYAAGYLMSHKIPVPDSAKKSQTAGESSNNVPINPITGQRLDKEPVNDLPEMTREEKEREAERLFVLFERLKATGVVDVKNPVEQARDEGRFEELSDSD
ncbi:uncharacterized protein Z518_04545 [Rhinocladiella mackenziei CBS 650.93]|uniref:Synembryn n=1 Tax=Rhinocladiella mackenziei CBS 650.93 TaxID=1442369 RepID=A0A0D2ILH3_9EURO|nr:uncharacterized protein Z518_04545 [Rhinocladiella mackenziei CBS 650.93]KIX06569.1 hypothetical protein Z518_04545 [Rhinocladiella mackenziei CBS 650.93]